MESQQNVNIDPQGLDLVTFEKSMPSWEHVFRFGFAPVLSDKALEVLLQALISDDQTLLQGCTTQPPPLMCVQDWPVEGGCALGFCGWKGEELPTVGEVEEFFARSCFEADQLLGEPAACRWFLNWFDDTPRDQMRADFIPVVKSVIKERIEKYAAVQNELLLDIELAILDDQHKWFEEHGEPVG